MRLRGHKILLGVSGGIAAYKACELASQLCKEEADVHTILTESATRFVSPLIFKTITYNQAHADQFSYDDVEPLHIELCREAELLILAPATANLIAKLAQGISDDLLSTVACAFRGPLLLAPAMNTDMWRNPITQANLARLREMLDVTVVEPAVGTLACRTQGPGKLASVEELRRWAGRSTSPSPLRGYRVLVSAGGTREPLDGARYLGNRGTGRMGEAIAEAAWQLGADVELVTTAPGSTQEPYSVTNVETAAQMMSALQASFATCDLLVMNAAVADYRPASPVKSCQKLHKRDLGDTWNLDLVANPDIVRSLAESKSGSQKLIGFTAETGDDEQLLEAARDKLLAKKLDAMLANPLQQAGSGYNRGVLLTANGNVVRMEMTDKEEFGFRFWESLGNLEIL